MKTSMIVVASEQIWPNLLGFLHWHKKMGGIERLFVYSTSNERKSLGPARRLKELIASTYPEVMILPVHDEPHGMTPEAVCLNIDEWIHSFPSDKWVINITGGTKIMTAGLLSFAGRPGVALIYRELGSGWFRISKDQRTDHIFCSKVEDIDEGIADSVPIDKMIMTQFDVAKGDRWVIEKARKLPILSIVEAAINMEWNWKSAFDAASVSFDASKTGGMLFEEVVAACLLELGVNNVMINARHLSCGKIQRQEIDVLASYNGVLYLVDCKLAFPDDPAVPKPVAQIKEAAETTKALGGLNAKTLMIRPSWDEDEDRAAFAKALGVRIIQRGSTETLLLQIAEWVGRPMNRVLQQTQTIIDSLRETSRYPFSNTKTKMIKTRRSPIISLIHDLLTAMDEDCQDWTCCVWRDTYHFLFRPQIPNVALKNALVRTLASYGQVTTAEYSDSKAILMIDLVPNAECSKKLKSMLEKKMNMNWLDTLAIEECDKQENPIPTSRNTSKTDNTYPKHNNTLTPSKKSSKYGKSYDKNATGYS